MSRHRPIDPLPTSPESLALYRTRARMALRAHLLVYATVCSGLVAIWALTPARVFWPGFVIAGWGVALLLQAFGTRVLAPGSPTWARVHAEELARARAESGVPPAADASPGGDTSAR